MELRILQCALDNEFGIEKHWPLLINIQLTEEVNFRSFDWWLSAQMENIIYMEFMEPRSRQLNHTRTILSNIFIYHSYIVTWIISQLILRFSVWFTIRIELTRYFSHLQFLWFIHSNGFCHSSWLTVTGNQPEFTVNIRETILFFLKKGK